MGIALKTFEASIIVNTPAARAWAVMSDVVAWPTWLPTVTSVTPRDAARLAPGGRYRIRQPKLPPALWKVTRVLPGAGFVWESTAPGVRVTADHQIETLSPQQCRATLRLTYAGWLGGWVGALFAAITQEYLNQEAAALKTAAEERAP